jgi:hypothetical protein
MPVQFYRNKTSFTYAAFIFCVCFSLHGCVPPENRVDRHTNKVKATAIPVIDYGKLDTSAILWDLAASSKVSGFTWVDSTSAVLKTSIGEKNS